MTGTGRITSVTGSLLGAGVLCLALTVAAHAETALPPADEAVTVPSGQDVRFVEMIEDADGPAGLTLRFRFLAPAITKETGSVDAETAHMDMQAICDGLALPYLRESGSQAVQIIVSFSDIPVVFGQPTPEATQFLEAYSFEGDSCIWEVL